MAGTGSPSTVVSIEMHLRRLRKNMREPPVSNNLSSRSEDFFFFTSAQLDAQFRNTQCDVALVRSRAACKPRQADTFGRLNRKTMFFVCIAQLDNPRMSVFPVVFLTDHQHHRTSVRCSETFGGNPNPIIVRCCQQDSRFGHLAPWTCVRSCGSRGRYHL